MSHSQIIPKINKDSELTAKSKMFQFKWELFLPTIILLASKERHLSD